MASSQPNSPSATAPQPVTISASATATRRVANLKHRRASSTGPVTTYEAQRISDHRSTYGKQGKLRAFWRKVQTHQKKKLQHLEYLAQFVRERATLQKSFATALVKLTEATSMQPVPTPNLSLDVACNELLQSELTSAKWLSASGEEIIREICDKGYDVLNREYRNSCAGFGKRAHKVSKKIDESHAHVLKCHRAYQNCYQSINQSFASVAGTSAAGGDSSSSSQFSTTCPTNTRDKISTSSAAAPFNKKKQEINKQQQTEKERPNKSNSSILHKKQNYYIHL